MPAAPAVAGNPGARRTGQAAEIPQGNAGTHTDITDMAATFGDGFHVIDITRERREPKLKTFFHPEVLGGGTRINQTNGSPMYERESEPRIVEATEPNMTDEDYNQDYEYQES